MIKKRIKNKLVNTVTSKGKKNTGEKLLLKCFKSVQKKSKNKFLELIKLAIINTTPIFKLHIIKNKKQKKKKKAVKKVPSFISNKRIKIALALKIIVTNAKKNDTKSFNQQLSQEIISSSQRKGLSVATKNEFQKEVLLNKNHLSYYRWS